MSEERSIPINPLDLNFRTIETVWYDGEMSPDLRRSLSRFYYQRDAEGNLKVDKNGSPVLRAEDFSGIMKLQTRDMRLSNLDTQSYRYAYWFQDFANDCALMGLPKSVALCLATRDSVLNLRQSTKGWKGELLNTFIQKSQKAKDDEPEKKSLLGMRKGD